MGTPGKPRAVVGSIVIDVNDLSAQTAFWTTLLDTEVLRSEADWIDVTRLGDDGPVLSLQLVPEAKGPKNRLHLDIMVDDFAHTSAVALTAGATAVSDLFEADTTPWQVFADPEGNEFCLISHY